jgi:hypothetical protein
MEDPAGAAEPAEPVSLIEPGGPPTGQDDLTYHDEDEDDLTLRDDDGGEP